MNRPTISLAMIVKNEEHNIPQVLGSVAGLFDEIHITDTGSTDQTVAIARSMGAHMHHFDWVDDFSAARNVSFQPITTDYVMWLDADDVLENRDAFLLWRDNAMGLADYWMAQYFYSSDEKTGKSTCTFTRERVFKVSKGFKWNYFVHEGVQPKTGGDDVKINFVNSWGVRHKRTESDLKADKSRNMRLFELNIDKLDARMQYYYGKELFENGKPVEAAALLLKSVQNDQMEPHDRILAIQYACYAYHACNQFERAVQLAHNGLQLAPLRAELHNIIADNYLKMNRLVEAIPYYQAAAHCGTPTDSVATPIFSHPESYYAYPKTQLARIYTNVGMFDDALREVEEVIKHHPNDESKEVKRVIEEHILKHKVVRSLKQSDDIILSCPPTGAYEWDADLYKRKGMGGSETAAIEMAYWLHKKSGRTVRVFNARKESKTCDGVEYSPTDKINDYLRDQTPYLHIAWRHNLPVTDAPTFLWSHDLLTPGAENHSQYNKILCLSPFHSRYTQAMKGIPESKIYITRNGISPERFTGTNPQKNPNKIVFPSSPDRGLDRCIRILDRVRVNHPDLELHVFYGFENLRKYGLAQMADELEAMIKERSWIKYHGFTQQDALISHFKESSIWLHPANFIETSCITAIEMMCSGVYSITRDLGALPDTLKEATGKGMACVIDQDCVTENEYALWAQHTDQALREKKWEHVHIDPKKYSWESIADEWLKDLPTFF